MNRELTALIEGGLPGLVLGSSRRGNREIIALGNRSSIDLNDPLPMNPATHFDLGSITKIAITTAALMDLVQDGKISLEDKISHFLAQWDTSEKSDITIRQLLQHRGGLWEWRPLYISLQDPSEVTDFISRLPLRYPVDKSRHYSDLGFITLGTVVARVLGTNLESLGFGETRFGSPFDATNVAATSRGDRMEKEMVSTHIPYPVPEKVEGFSRWRTHILSGEVNDGNAFHLLGSVSGHAGLFSNAESLLSFGESLLQHPQFEYFTNEGPDVDAHLGFRSWVDTYEGCTDRFYGHTGYPGTVIGVSRAHEAVATLLTNRLHVDGAPMPTEDLWRPILTAFHQELHQ